MPNATDRDDPRDTRSPQRSAASGDRDLAMRRAQHVARLVKQDYEALLRAMELAAALRSFASACVERSEPEAA